MPQLLRALTRMGALRSLPIPTLKNYISISILLFVIVLYHAYRTILFDQQQNDEIVQKILNESSTALLIGAQTRQSLADSLLYRVIYYCLADQAIIWVIVNSACCAMAAFGWCIRWMFFGALRSTETQLLRDRFWNYALYRVVFVFGVLNATYVDEVVLWIFWFMTIGLVYLLTTLSNDRFKYMSNTSATSSGQQRRHRLLVLTSLCLLAAANLVIMSIVGFRKFGIHYGLFLMAESLMLLLRSSYCTFRYALFFYDLKRDTPWEVHNSLIYYAEFIFELSADIIDLLHHVHMLIWTQIVLSMASLVIFVQIRYIYQQIDTRIRRHGNYKRITKHMDDHYPMTAVENVDETCAICWDQIQLARKLPCGHLFHNWCLRGWFEQDSTCPTCRLALAIGIQPVAPGGGGGDGGADGPVAVVDATGAELRRRAVNHFFHFDGRRYARWLPSFSVEVSHNLNAPAFFGPRRTVNDSQLNTMAEQVREMFPQFPVALILEDLRDTASSQATVENILEGRLMGGGGGGGTTSDDSTTELDDDMSDGSLDGGTEYDHPSPSAHTSTAPSYGIFASTSNEPSIDTAALSLSTGVIVGGRFSKSSDERENILGERKRALIDVHRRRYLASPRGADLRQLSIDDAGLRRRL